MPKTGTSPPKRPASGCRPCVQVKSYLTGNPPIAIALNDGLVIGRREGGGAAEFGYGRASEVVQLDDCNFHEARLPCMPLHAFVSICESPWRVCMAVHCFAQLCMGQQRFLHRLCMNKLRTTCLTVCVRCRAGLAMPRVKQACPSLCRLAHFAA